MPLNRGRLLESLEHYTQSEVLDGDQYAFFRAICLVQMGEYAAAHALFVTSAGGMLRDRIWFKSGQPNWLVEVCALSGCLNLYDAVAAELAHYRTDDAGNSVVALYAYGLMGVLIGTSDAVGAAVTALARRPKLKDWYAKGQALKAIEIRDEIALRTALLDLLKAHEGIAKHGSLRWSAEGFLSMPAMALAYAARKQGLRVEIENDYFSQGYLDYLIGLETGAAKA